MAAVKEPKDRMKKRHPKSEKFEYKCDEGTIRITYIENIPYAVIDDMSEMSEQASQKFLLTSVMSEEDYELFRSLTLGEFKDAFDAWDEASALSLGEL